MVNMLGRLDLYLFRIGCQTLLTDSEGLVIRPDETIFVLRPFPDVRCR
jgi:hypothetical protein